MDDVFLQSTSGLLRSAVLIVGSYVGLLLFLRVAGKRSLSKMNAFDLVVTVALGSTLATIALSKDTALLQGLTVMAGLLLLQFLVSWLSVRSGAVCRLVKAEPRLLFHHGTYLEAALKHERVTTDEVLAAIRAQGFADLTAVRAVVLETDGSLSVISGEAEQRSSLEDVNGFKDSGNNG